MHRVAEYAPVYAQISDFIQPPPPVANLRYPVKVEGIPNPATTYPPDKAGGTVKEAFSACPIY